MAKPPKFLIFTAVARLKRQRSGNMQDVGDRLLTSVINVGGVAEKSALLY